ncbi:S1C family serine protease [Lacipirellula limnantheis]|nr:trypsin-like peptidase domain-containing protein [Lacipirellula limnantheis]
MKKLHDWARRRHGAALMVGAAWLALGPVVSAVADEPPSRSRRQREESRQSSEEVDPADDTFGMERLFVPRWRLTDGPQVRAAFRDVVKDASAATVSIECDGKRLALGGIISPDGWVVTKATPLCGKLTAVLADGHKLPATTVAESGEHDLALLKLDAAKLPALDLTAAGASPPVGSWLASVGRSKDPVAVGVVSVPPRVIPAQAGILGVQLDEEKPLIVQVFPDSAAEEAGVEPEDLIMSVNGQKTSSREKLREVIGSFNPGDEVELLVDRAGEQVTLHATLSGDFPGLPMGRSEFQNNLGGKLSVRRFGFPLAFQHDTVLRPADCGGPVVDVEGRVVGFNIARAGRTESYALPVDAVQGVLTELMKEHLLVKQNSPEAEAAEKLEQELGEPAANAAPAAKSAARPKAVSTP